MNSESNSASTATEEDQSDAAARRAKGEFVRGVTGFRNAIGDADFPAEPNRYHLYVALTCPWCHRATLARAVLGLQDSITMDVAFPSRTDEEDPEGPNFWQFDPTRVSTLTGQTLSECTQDTATGHSYRLARDIYRREGSQERTLPILFDKKTGRIVSNESAEILRMMDRNAKALGSNIPETQRPALVPDDPEVLADVTALNDRIYQTVNNGAYKAGFSTDQAVYAAAFNAYFETLDWLEDRLSDGRDYLTGSVLTEADLRLFPTIFRHDPIYTIRMKLNQARILDYPHLWRWLCRVYALEGIAEASSLVHCRQGNFGRSWNRTIPLGPSKPMPYPEAYRHPELAVSN